MQLAPECAFPVDGFLAQVIVFAVPLAVLAGVGVLAAYRRAVRRAMAARSAAPENPPPLPPGERPLLRLSLLALDARVAWHEDVLGQTATRRVRATAAGQALAGSVLALLLTLLYFVFIPLAMSPVRFLAVWLVYVWPLVPALMLLLLPGPAAKLALAAGYFVLLAAVDLALDVLPGVRDGPGTGDLFVMWAMIMGIPTVLLLALSNRALRSVGLLAFLFAVAGVAGFILSFQLVGCWILTTRSAALIPWLPLIQTAAAGLMLWLAWRELRRIAAGWEAKRFSDQSLTLDGWWLTTTFAIAVFNSGRAGMWTFLFLLPWFAYRWLTRRQWRRQETAGAPRELLLLRVFGFTRRSRALLDAVGQRWRAVGPINMIAGTDLAAACFDPGELLQFLGGRLRTAFIADAADLARRLAALDDRPDADGRYRINECFCFDDTWRPTVTALARRSAVVLMDLRRFGPGNDGCRYELGLLLAQVPLERVLLLIDDDTDYGLLERTLRELWQTHGPPVAAPGAAEGAPVAFADLRILRISGQSPREIAGLTAYLSTSAA